MTPYPHQEVARDFLAARRYGILADDPRVGKTGSALLAKAKVGAKKTLIVTTASGRPVWHQGALDWLGQEAHENTGVAYSKLTEADLAKDCVIVSWAGLRNNVERLIEVDWDLVIADEAHNAKNRKAKQTQALFEKVIRKTERMWLLTGTPIANTPIDIYPAMRAFDLLHDRIKSYYAFEEMFCIKRTMKIGRQQFDKIVGHQNLPMLGRMLADHMLRRTQQDVGITEPITETVPLHVKPSDIRKIAKELESADPDALEMICGTGDLSEISPESFATLRRITGIFKSPAVAELVKDDFEGGMRKLVVMCWHRNTLDVIEKEVRNAGIQVYRVDGSVVGERRKQRETDFRSAERAVFLGQIQSCGEAIDLSSASDLLFAETSYSPKDMKQASLRITNHGQTAQPRVRIATLAGSIDERVQSAVLKKLKDILVVEGAAK